jgi:hypothetical protein
MAFTQIEAAGITSTSTVVLQNATVTGVLTATSGFVGNLTGSVIGAVTGNVTGNLSPSSGVTINSPVTNTLAFVTNNTERARFDSSGNLQFNSGYGSVATAYACRAWVNFNGTTASPSTIRGSGNVTSVTKTATGQYTVNFSTNMPDVNYSVVSMSESETQATTNRSSTVFSLREGTTPTISQCSLICKQGNFSTATSLDIDKSFMNVAIFR